MRDPSNAETKPRPAADALVAGMTVLVTGGAGFIGTNLVRRLVTLGAGVRVLDDFSTGRRANLEGLDGIEIVEADLCDADAVSLAARGCDAVLHHAALASVPASMEDPVATYRVNVLGTACVLDAAHRCAVERVVIASSSAVYGDDPAAIKVEASVGRPLSPYAASKAAGETVADAASNAHGVAVVSLRYFNVYGPWQRADSPYAGVVPLFATALVEGRPPVIFGDGSQVRDLVHVDDVVDANILALAALPARSGARYNVASGRPCSILELFEAVRRAAGREDIAPTFAPPRPGDIHESRADISLARTELGFAPKWGLDEGLRSYVAWGREHGAS